MLEEIRGWFESPQAEIDEMLEENENIERLCQVCISLTILSGESKTVVHSGQFQRSLICEFCVNLVVFSFFLFFGNNALSTWGSLVILDPLVHNWSRSDLMLSRGLSIEDT